MTWLLITAQGRTATSWCPPSSSTLCPSWRPPGSRPASRAGSPCRWGPEAAPSPPPSAVSFVSCILTIRKNHAASYWCFCKRFSILKKKCSSTSSSPLFSAWPQPKFPDAQGWLPWEIHIFHKYSFKFATNLILWIVEIISYLAKSSKPSCSMSTLSSSTNTCSISVLPPSSRRSMMGVLSWRLGAFGSTAGMFSRSPRISGSAA